MKPKMLLDDSRNSDRFNNAVNVRWIDVSGEAKHQFRSTESQTEGAKEIDRMWWREMERQKWKEETWLTNIIGSAENFPHVDTTRDMACNAEIAQFDITVRKGAR